MGATASVKLSSGSTPAQGDMNSKALSSAGVSGDIALRQVLRNLQLSPDLVDKSAAAIYAHVRDPVEHPVDEELARLCTSEYTRGALHALSWYLLAVSDVDRRHGSAKHFETVVGEPAAPQASGSRNAPSAEAAGSSRSRVGADPTEEEGAGDAGTGGGRGRGTGGEGPPSSGNLSESVSGKLATLLNRLRRTRSMPVVVPTEGGVGTGAQHPSPSLPGETQPSADAGAGAGAGDGAGAGTAAPTPPKLNVRVGGTPKTPRKGSNFLGGLGLGSPSGRAAGEVATPRRAPVRTGHWKLGHEIGKGSFGAVHIGLNEESGDLIAVKVLSLKNADQAEELYTEIELMRQLTHPNIVCYLGAEVNDSEKSISIFQEWIPGSVTTLLVNFGPFSDRRIAGYTKQILHGLVYLHSERVIHRDIKGGNILIDDRGVVKLCDFGASKLLDAESFAGVGDHTRVGSPLFMAPEILLREEYGPQVDIWSLGGAVLEMATGQPPWHTLNLRTPVALINWVKRTDGPPPLPEGLSQPLTKFLLRCFERNPSKRATAKELLSDPFVAKRRGERALLPKGSAAGSDADSVVSDIDNLSRAAAIARIRRASMSDHSRPNSENSARSAQSAPTPRAPGHREGAGGGGGGGGGRGGGGYAELAQQVVASLEDAPPAPACDGGTPPRRPVSLQSALKPRLRVETAGLEPAVSSPSSAPRVVTPPPTRRVSVGRNSPGTPNPFGGRRRSLDTSHDSARSSCSPRAGGGPPAALASSSGSRQDAGAGGAGEGCGGEGGRVCVENSSENAASGDAAAAAAAGAVAATASVAANRPGGDSSCRAGTKCDPSASAEIRRSVAGNGGSTRRETKVVGDPATPVVTPAPDALSPSLVPQETALPLQVSEREEVEVRKLGPLKKLRSGRGARPGGRPSGDGEMVAWNGDNQ